MSVITGLDKLAKRKRPGRIPGFMNLDTIPPAPTPPWRERVVCDHCQTELDPEGPPPTPKQLAAHRRALARWRKKLTPEQAAVVGFLSGFHGDRAATLFQATVPTDWTGTDLTWKAPRKRRTRKRGVPGSAQKKAGEG